MRDLPESTVLVTGSSRGIGAFLAERYATMGAKVFGCGRGDADWQHPNYQHLIADVSKEADVKAMMKTIRREAGHLDVIVNNAGIASMNAALLTPATTIEALIGVNFVGTALVAREGAKMIMRGKLGGRIVNFTSVAVPLRLEGESYYAASKAAVEQLTRVLAHELGPYDITVNCVGPNPIETDLIRGVPSDKLNDLLSAQAIPRFGTFEDVANLVDFYLKPASSMVTGQVVYLGGIS